VGEQQNEADNVFHYNIRLLDYEINLLFDS